MKENSTFDKVAYLVPSEDVRISVEKALENEISEGWVSVLTVDQDDVAGEYQSLVSKGYGCIVARGGTYHELLGLQTTVPVIEERIRTAATYFSRSPIISMKKR